MRWFRYRTQGSRRMIGTTMVYAVVTFSPVRSISILFLAIGLASAPAGAADAASLCANVKTLVREARSNFSNWATDTPRAAVPLMLSGAKDCALTQSLSGSKTYHCTWQFPYRAAGAHGTFDAFNRTLRECLGDPAPSSRDQRVNHPDFYDLRQYRFDEVEVAVSIKDKSALQKTHLFLRVHGGNLD